MRIAALVLMLFAPAAPAAAAPMAAAGQNGDLKAVVFLLLLFALIALLPGFEQEQLDRDADEKRRASENPLANPKDDRLI